MRKSMMIGVLGIATLTYGQARQPAAQSNSSGRVSFPKACYFFERDPAYRPDPKEGQEERNYDAAFREVYRTWCTPNGDGPAVREKSADTLVAAWRSVYERESPQNARFYETSTSDLLELMALTHELPSEMAHDPAFAREWVEACIGTCFTIWSVPENRKQEHWLAMQLWLRNDVLDHLKREPASEPVIKMLEEAQFRLVD